MTDCMQSTAADLGGACRALLRHLRQDSGPACAVARPSGEGRGRLAAGLQAVQQHATARASSSRRCGAGADLPRRSDEGHEGVLERLPHASYPGRRRNVYHAAVLYLVPAQTEIGLAAGCLGWLEFGALASVPSVHTASSHHLRVHSQHLWHSVVTTMFKDRFSLLIVP